MRSAEVQREALVRSCARRWRGVLGRKDFPEDGLPEVLTLKYLLNFLSSHEIGTQTSAYKCASRHVPGVESMNLMWSG